MAVVTFPHLGVYTPAFTWLLTQLGNTVITPQPPGKQTLTLGAVHGPEFACIPLKMCLGTFIEGLDQGADTIVTSGGVGPCRAGLYGTVQREILRSLGYKFDMIVLEPFRRHPVSLLRSVHKLNAAGLSPLRLLQTARQCWAMIKACDVLEHALLKLRPREVEVGSAERVFQRGLKKIFAAHNTAEIDQTTQAVLAEMQRVPIDPNRDPVRVGIVGEIYVLLEPEANLHIERILGEYGAEVHRAIFLTGWTEENVIREGDNETARQAAAPYLDEMIGGHGQDTVGHTVLYAKEGVDGVIQLAPFTCIPEIVARAVLPSVSNDHDIPVISFFLDEQTGEAGYRTRLEAFVDLLTRRRDKRRKAS
ncbi:MAG TPA: CoA protein activase [Firmicutes bacterium]|nr:CoA protein activase [Bacillota bacterium]